MVKHFSQQHGQGCPWRPRNFLSCPAKCLGKEKLFVIKDEHGSTKHFVEDFEFI